MPRFVWPVVFMAVACSGPNGRAATSPEPVAPPPSARDVARVDAGPTATLRLEWRADGAVLLVANDRWGHAVNATYENASYLQRALPVMERALGPGDFAELKRALERHASSAAKAE